MRSLFILWLVALCIFADEPPQEPELLPSMPQDRQEHFLLFNLINPLTGNLSLKKTDLIVQGAQELRLERIYTSPYIPGALHDKKKHRNSWDQYHLFKHLFQSYKGWQFFPHLRLEYFADQKIVRVPDKNGTVLDFKISKRKGSRLLSDTYGITNLSEEVPSGKNDPQNTRIRIEKNLILVRAPDGSTRFYEHFGKNETAYLQKEVLPNGKILRYYYQQSLLQYVESLSPDESIVYASIRIDGHPWYGHYQCTSSAQDKVTYTYERRPVHVLVKEKRKLGDISEEIDGFFPPILKHVSSPKYRNEREEHSDRFLLNHMESDIELFDLQYAIFGKQYRLRALQLPTGPKGSMEEACILDYSPPKPGERGGVTKAAFADGTSTIYRYNRELRPDAIERYDEHGALKYQKKFTWNFRGWLKIVEELDGSGQLFTKKSFEYDRFGNPILETLIGNLSGEGGLESYSIVREHSQDGRNLLLKEETEEGKITKFEYLQNTNLLTRKIIQDREKVLILEEYRYDKHHNLIEKRIKGGGQESITTIHLRQEAPFIHMPEWIEEKSALKRHFLYDKWGNVCEEEVFDADGQFAYTIKRTYNERGDLLSETNALGQKKTNIYDDKGHLTKTTNFSGRLQTLKKYDRQGRAIAKEYIGEEGIRKNLSYKYDEKNNLIRKTDEYDYKTYYVYDSICQKPKTIKYPLEVTTHATYDPLGRQTSKTDENGHTTFYEYTTRGDLTEIFYPNGTRETFRYYRNGNRKDHTNLDGLTTHYQYDILNRTLSERTDFFEETYTYCPFHLRSKIDRLGNCTEYQYDRLGRKIEENHCGRITRYTYDPLGRIETIYAENGENSFHTQYERDLLDRVLSIEQSNHKISYRYDADGNRKEIIRYIENKPESTAFLFDSFGRLISQTDPLGNTTSFFYGDIPQKITTTPRGIHIIENYDPFGQLTQRKTQNSQGQTIAKKAYHYDPCGNLSTEIDHIYRDTEYLNTQVVSFSYSSMNKLESYTRGKDRTTYYSYTPAGQIATKTLPNGTTLQYRYNLLGFRTHLTSSDGTIQHEFERNLLGDLLRAKDLASQIEIHRKVDPFGNVLKETFSTGLVLKKTYDACNRPLTVTLPNQTKIDYSYDPLHLKSVTYLGHTHTFDEYDLDGNLTQEQLIGNCGTIRHEYDPKGRPTHVTSPHLQQSMKYDASDNLITLTEGNRTCEYSYDDLNQLTTEEQSDYVYDSKYNRLEKNEKKLYLNELDEVQIHQYDPNGNLTETENAKYKYDALSQLIEANGTKFLYDPLGRRLIKEGETTEYYLWDSEEEIGAYKDRTFLNLKVQANGKPILIELSGQSYAPILDIQGNIRSLIDLSTKRPAISHQYTAFGEDTLPSSLKNPWRYASKRYDVELNLYYFGKRYYDPEYARWLTTDPMGFVQGTNLYLYLFNNPYRYIDPDGQFVFAIPLIVWGVGAATPGLTAIGTAVAASIAGGAIAYGGYKLVDALNTEMSQQYYSNGMVSIPNDFATPALQRKKQGGVDATLSADPKNDPNLEDISHPQAKEKGHYQFKDKKSGEIVHLDKGKPGEKGHEAHDHYHRPNPNATGRKDTYLDAEGNPTPRGNEASHLYPPEWIWWE